MKFLASLLTATALLSSCVSAIPLTEDHILALRADNGKNVDKGKKTQTTQDTDNTQSPNTASEKPQTTQDTDNPQSTSTASEIKEDYPIEEELKNWIDIDHVKTRLERVCSTQGGSEGWTQFEFEDQFKTAFGISDEHQVREVYVYTPAKQAADLVLPPTEQYNGMIIELKCENKNTNFGGAMKKIVSDDIEKEKELKPQYKGYTFRVLAMAYSEKAGTALENLGLKTMPGVEAKLKKGVVKMYQKTISTGSAGDGVDEITQGIGSLNTDDKNEDKNTDNAETGNTKSDQANTGEATAGEASTGKTKTSETNTKGSKKAGSKKAGGKKDSGKKGGSGEGTSEAS